MTERIAKDGFSPYSQAFIKTNIDDFNRNDLALTEYQDSLRTVTEELQKKARLQEIASYRLEHSYIGHMGKAIEPLVQPMGYDWKIGIALITSFAAREVFVSTLATIYSVGNDEEETIKNRMAAEINEKTEKPLFNLASGISLLLFYAFAMQCMSTLAIVKKETNSWKWPMLQLVFMSTFAYLVALIAYQVLK